MEMDEEFRLSPPWKHALQILLDRGIADGTILEKAELVGMFGLRAPVTAADQERFQLDFMKQFSALRELLEDHRIALRTMYGESSYQVVPPQEQTSYFAMMAYAI